MSHHRALDNHDIISHVVEYLGPPAQRDCADVVDESLSIAPGKAWRTLAYCARTSKAFSRPALRVLWRELPSLLPLLSLAGISLINAETPESLPEDDEIEMIRTTNEIPTPQGMQRFASVSVLVQRISLPGLTDPSLLFHLSRAAPSGSLLPMLSEIRCMTTPFLDMTILCLAGHNLRELVVLEDSGASWDRPPNSPEGCAVRRLLAALPSTAPGLHTLCIYDKGTHELPYIAYIGRLRELRSLRLRFWPDELVDWLGPFMSTLAKFEHLRDLALPLEDWVMDELPIPQGFAQLRSLRFEGNEHSDLTCLYHLGKILPRLPRLERLEIASTYVNSFTEDNSYLDGIVGKCVDTLTTVKMDIRPGGIDLDLPSPVPAFNLLRTFIPLHHLQFCYISYSENMSFTDVDLRKFQGAWPLLQTFALSWKRPYLPHTAPSFHGIVEFLRERPQLAVLKLPVVDINGNCVRCKDIKALPPSFVVEDGCIPDPIACARVLRTLLPQIRIKRNVVKSACGEWATVLSRLRDTNKYV
ncbi:uncharacterized protein C8Q71DRAFT_852965 [Rhodofomes roseus]|uniref:Leucine rich repeat (LRR) protein n=1 Tax=Rhodofomes roseus TaxID=34475 RepID=A0ABQ8KTJ3_9APHY|nr:uncharacterized protein C8Q71DRAFT_852965 [Rhodofomes roseus]KAH9842403.1 hypothetical protein C8Q71DRAFT_852965 [Rhodofomes roseus]